MNLFRTFVLSMLVCACGAFAQDATGPLTLEQVVREAVDRNPRLLAERLNVSVAEARIIQARLKPNPVFSAGGNYLNSFDPARSTGGPTELNGRIDYVVERGQKREARVANAEAARSVAQIQVQDSVRSLILAVQSGFTDVLLAKENLAVAKSSLDSFTQIVNINKVRVAAGDLAKVEYIRSEVAALQFANQVRQAELRLRQARNQLQALMGRVVFAPDFDVTGDLRRDPLASAQPEILKAALAARPDLEALRRDQARSLADLRLQLAQGKVDYTVGVGVNRQFGAGNLSGANSAGVFISVPLPVYNRNEGEIERARREQTQIQTRIKALEQQIAAEVENAYQQFSTSRALLQQIESDMLERAREVRATTEYSYRRGEATFVELLDAQRTFNETLQGFNEARAEYARSLYVIDAIQGGTQPASR